MKCVYIYYIFFLVGFVFNSVIYMMANPSLKECRILMLENGVERKVSVYEHPGLRAKS